MPNGSFLSFFSSSYNYIAESAAAVSTAVVSTVVVSAVAAFSVLLPQEAKEIAATATNIKTNFFIFFSFKITVKQSFVY